MFWHWMMRSFVKKKKEMNTDQCILMNMKSRNGFLNWTASVFSRLKVDGERPTALGQIERTWFELDDQGHWKWRVIDYTGRFSRLKSGRSEKVDGTKIYKVDGLRDENWTISYYENGDILNCQFEFLWIVHFQTFRQSIFIISDRSLSHFWTVQ